MDWSTACQDWERRIVAGRSLIPLKPLYPSEAERALSVFKALKIVDIPGQPTFGEVSEQWVFDFVAAIFGAYDGDTGRQAIREFFLLISKKNTKSTVGAAIMLTALIINWRQNEELLILAPTVEIAKNSFDPAAAMVRADPELNAGSGGEGFLLVTENVKTITHLTTKAKLKVVAADTDTVGGKKAGRILIDELWIFGKRQSADAMLREATGGMVSRPEGFIISLSTQSDAPPAGVFADKLSYARKVRDGEVVDKKFLPVLYEFPQKMIDANEHLDPSNFYVTNPNLGRSVSSEWLEDELRREMEKGPETRNTFLAKHLNIEIGMGLRSNRWPGADFWPKRVDKNLTLDGLIDRSEAIVIGIDGGGLDDLFGLSVLGRERTTKHWLAWSHAWAHNSVLERRKSIASKLMDFAGRGELTIVRDDLDDIQQIMDVVQQVNASGRLVSVCVDPAGIGEIADALGEIGITVENGKLIGVSQGYMLMNAVKTAERKLANGTLIHAPSTLMDWCIGNLKIEPTATAIRVTKQTAGDAKIDPAMALFDAAMFMSRNPEVKGGRIDDFLQSPIMVI